MGADKESRSTLRFENFQKAVVAFEKATAIYARLNDLERDGLIQRFEFTFELAWKVMQDYLFETGYNGLKGPRNAIKQMGQDGHIDPFIWLEMMNARNDLSHIYDAAKSRLYLESIQGSYFSALLQFQEKFRELQKNA